MGPTLAMTGRPTCLHDVVRRANADAPALISGERTMSFGELGEAIDRAAMRAGR